MSTLLALSNEAASASLGGIVVVFLLFGLLSTAYWVWMLVDVVRRDDAELRAGSKMIWVVVMVVAGVLGSVVYQFTARPKTA